ncbi:3-oxoacyl-ACP synthase [Actinokineospora bangkokensis]|uniref:3-oxoacyl-ACP synthase n=1 Tax=Actinokineospora bangkokensis TaxID=1193682 RepID=A0A1Q9LPX5_9PSEU|nr:3-oxoacyl-ACP synthase [Actinokineospora bangkokensis]
MRQSSGAPGARIAGFGAHRPGAVVGSAEIARRFGRTAEWVRERTGIVARRHAAGETREAMAVAAGARALERSDVDGSAVDLVVVASCSAESPRTGLAALVADGVGAVGAAGYDLNAACAGFCYALAVAADAVRAGSARCVLVVGAEKMTSWVDPADLGTSIIFGDGAGAAVVVAADEPDIGPVVWGSDGSQAELIDIPVGVGVMRMQGQAVFRWATNAVHPVALRACEQAGVVPRQLDAIVPHQANLRIVEALARKLDAPDAVVARDVVDAGNTSAASIPLALDRLLAEGDVKPGGLALLIGFGAGLAYAAQVVRLPRSLPVP